jgi:uncharacterized phiE125 gp8 family phage protein
MRCLDFQVTAPPAILPVTIDEFIDHARLNALTVDRQPDLLTRQLTAATNRAESFCRRSLITQTLRALFVPDGLTCRCSLLLALPRSPVQSVISVTSDGTVVDPTTYRLDWNTIVLSSALGQPATAVFTGGYGDAAEDVPAMIREGILEYAKVLYEARGGEREDQYAVQAGKTLPPGVIDLWRPYQVELGG